MPYSILQESCLEKLEISKLQVLNLPINQIREVLYDDSLEHLFCT